MVCCGIISRASPEILSRWDWMVLGCPMAQSGQTNGRLEGYVTLACLTASRCISELIDDRLHIDCMSACVRFYGRIYVKWMSNTLHIYMKESISERMYAICESQFKLISHHLRIKIDSSKDTRPRYVPSRCQWLSVPKSSPTLYPRYLSQGPTANFIAVLVETGGGIDLKNHPQLAKKVKHKSLSLFFNSIAERSNVFFFFGFVAFEWSKLHLEWSSFNRLGKDMGEFMHFIGPRNPHQLATRLQNCFLSVQS